MSGFTERSATRDDAEGILAVGIARDVEDIGYPDYSLDDVLEELAEADVALVVPGEAGEVVASALLTGADARVNVHPRACGAGIGTNLRERMEEAARGRGASLVHQYVSGSNDAARRLLDRAGYVADQRYWRMVRELDGGEAAGVAWPDGVRTRTYEAGADDQAAHALVQDAFRDIPGNVERGFEAWRATSVGGAQFAPDLSTVALDGDEVAGVALCERWEDGQGYVGHLAVARGWQGRGLGRALLAESLARMQSAGLTAATLGVNARNESATRLYESVGMRVGFRAERWEKGL
jgi:mycothiol synthase